MHLLFTEGTNGVDGQLDRALDQNSHGQPDQGIQQREARQSHRPSRDAGRDDDVVARVYRWAVFRVLSFNSAWLFYCE